jgi:putative ABC transport system permease protein
MPAIYWMAILSVRLIPDRISFGKFLPQFEGVRMDGAVIGCALLAAVLVGVFLGFVPALHLSRIRLGENLKEGCRGYLDMTAAGLRNWMVIAEVAAAFVLVIGAGLLMRSFDNLLHVDPGFRAEHVTTASVYLPPSKYLKLEQQWDFFRRVLATVRETPGIEAAGAVNMLPMSEWPNPTLRFRLESQPDPPPGARLETIVRVATTG